MHLIESFIPSRMYKNLNCDKNFVKNLQNKGEVYLSGVATDNMMSALLGDVFLLYNIDFKKYFLVVRSDLIEKRIFLTISTLLAIFHLLQPILKSHDLNS